MKKLTWPFIFLFLISFTAIIGQKKKLPMGNQNQMTNTTFLDSPKVYVFKMTIPATQLQPTMDTLDLVLNMMGKSLSVDQSEQYKTLAVRNIRRLIGSPQLDSITSKK